MWPFLLLFRLSFVSLCSFCCSSSWLSAWSPSKLKSPRSLDPRPPTPARTARIARQPAADNRPAKVRKKTVTNKARQRTRTDSDLKNWWCWHQSANRMPLLTRFPSAKDNAGAAPPTCSLGRKLFSRICAPRGRALLLLASVASTSWSSWGSGSSLPYPPLSVVERALATTAKDAFNGHAKGFEAAAQWDGERLRASRGSARAPHLACAEHSRGREAIARLERFLSPEAVRPVSHSSAHGACFFVTASHAEARAISGNAQLGLLSIAPFPSALKVAPGVLEHGDSRDQESQSPERLTTTHGRSMRMSNVEGLNVELSPGILPAHAPQANAFIAHLLSDLMSESINLHAANVWSDPGVASGEHLTTLGGALREREWSMAAGLVNDLGVSGRTTPGDICSWDNISVHHAANDLLLVSGAHLPVTLRAVTLLGSIGRRRWNNRSYTGSCCVVVGAGATRSAVLLLV